MQRQADLLAMPVVVSQEPDMTALGAALLAGIGAGRLNRGDLRSMTPETQTYEPEMSADERQSLWAEWQSSINMVLERSAS